MTKASKLGCAIVGALLIGLSMQALFMPPRFRDVSDKFEETRSGSRFVIYRFDGSYMQGGDAISQTYPPEADIDGYDSNDFSLKVYRSGAFFVFVVGSTGQTSVCVRSASTVDRWLYKAGLWEPDCP